jgi:uncharacterized membrane protein
MADPKLILLVVFLTSGSLLTAVSVPLIRGRVPPNPLYGFRTRRTLADPAVWYPANRYAAWRLLWLGATLVVTATGLYFVPGVGFPSYAVACAAVLLGGMAVALVQSFRYVRRLGDG